MSALSHPVLNYGAVVQLDQNPQLHGVDIEPNDRYEYISELRRREYQNFKRMDSKGVATFEKRAQDMRVEPVFTYVHPYWID